MANVNKRVTDLENASGTKGGLAVIYEGEPMAKISQPGSRKGQEITVEDFRAQYPEGTLITVVRSNEQKSQ